MNKEIIKEKIEIAFSNFYSALEKHKDLNIKRIDGGWSVGEIGDHIIKSTYANFGNTQQTERAYNKNEESIKNTFLNFDVKYTAAPTLLPSEKKYNITVLVNSIESNKKTLLNMINKEDLTETCLDIEVPVWGKLTKYEWLTLMENHIIRHTKQVNDFVPGLTL